MTVCCRSSVSCCWPACSASASGGTPEHDQTRDPFAVDQQACAGLRAAQAVRTHADGEQASLLGKPYLLNVFASWCVECGVEHPVLQAEAPTLGVALVGYNYKDAPDDAKAWLATHGNPYNVLMPEPGHTAIDFGVYGCAGKFPDRCERCDPLQAHRSANDGCGQR
jgi:cytochrome c biogenesis protein CcmG/thiol:disulfide interchange protein DsbE